jgi:hypothetical protein
MGSRTKEYLRQYVSHEQCFKTVSGRAVLARKKALYNKHDVGPKQQISGFAGHACLNGASYTF